MDFIGDKITSVSNAGDRYARPKWAVRADSEDFDDYESMFKTFMEKIFSNNGSFKVDGSLLFEFVPKTYTNNNKLIDAETFFQFHKIEEKTNFIDLEDDYEGSALKSYEYQKHAPLPTSIEQFMPEI